MSAEAAVFGQGSVLCEHRWAELADAMCARLHLFVSRKNGIMVLSLDKRYSFAAEPEPEMFLKEKTSGEDAPGPRDTSDLLSKMGVGADAEGVEVTGGAELVAAVADGKEEEQWERFLDEETGNYYWFNTVSGGSRWEEEEEEEEEQQQQQREGQNATTVAVDGKEEEVVVDDGQWADEGAVRDGGAIPALELGPIRKEQEFVNQYL